MEIIALQKKAILIPTPGQTEQEYLAKELMRKGYFYSAQQKHFDLCNIFELSKKYNPPEIQSDQINNTSLILKTLETRAS